MDIIETMLQDVWSPASMVEGESSGMYDAVTGALAGKRSALAKELDKGVSPADFKNGQALLGAYDAALAGLEKIHSSRKTE